MKWENNLMISLIVLIMIKSIVVLRFDFQKELVTKESNIKPKKCLFLLSAPQASKTK